MLGVQCPVTLLAGFSLFYMGFCGASELPKPTDPAFIKQYVDEHNKFRSRVTPSASNMRYMTWDPALAKLAYALAKKCRRVHKPDTAYPIKPHPAFQVVGENIWIGRSYGVQSPVVVWHNERKNYINKSNECSGVCTHYTQVVWADTYKVGCAALQCPEVKGVQGSKTWATVVCNYGPAK